MKYKTFDGLAIDSCHFYHDKIVGSYECALCHHRADSPKCISGNYGEAGECEFSFHCTAEDTFEIGLDVGFGDFITGD